MGSLTTFAVLVVMAALVTFAYGWRDGWLTLPLLDRNPKRKHFVRGSRAFNHVAIVEITQFKAVRRSVGYLVANQIMRELAGRIGPDDRYEVRRVGRTSIEFLYSAASAADALATLTELRSALEQTVAIDAIQFDPEVIIGSSAIGSAEAEDEPFDRSALAVEAAHACPERIGFYLPDEMGVEPARSTRMLSDLSEAIRCGGLELHYLPKLSLTEERIISAEALCRWSHPLHGNVPPTDFIGLAEETGLIDDLTLVTIDCAIADQRRLLERGITLAIDVNLSGRLVSKSDFCDVIVARIAGASGKIGLEITETAVIENPDAALANLHRIANAGIHIAIDDFGSGLSSLSYLRDLPAHELKIDQGFIRKLTTSNRDPLLVRSAIEIGHALEMEVTAEGVEDEMALSLLSVMRCNNVQGYHISPPLTLAGLIEYLENGAKLPSNELVQLRDKFAQRTAVA